MERKAFMLRLHPEYVERYVEAHRNVWPELLERYRRAGIKTLSVFTSNRTLFLYIEADNIEAANASLAEDEMELKWQRFMNPMIETNSEQILTEVFHMN